MGLGIPDPAPCFPPFHAGTGPRGGLWWRRLLVPPLHRVASLIPRDDAALERHHAVAVVPRVDQPPRRTGAGVLVGSGAVQDDRLTLRHRPERGMIRRPADRLERNGDRSSGMGISIEPGVASVHQDGVAIFHKAAGIRWRDAADRPQGLAGDSRFAQGEASPYVCLPLGSLSFLRVASDSSMKTAGGSLAGKESIDASSTRRSRRIRCSSDEAGWLIRILHPTIVAIA